MSEQASACKPHLNPQHIYRSIGKRYLMCQVQTKVYNDMQGEYFAVFQHTVSVKFQGVTWSCCTWSMSAAASSAAIIIYLVFSTDFFILIKFYLYISRGDLEPLNLVAERGGLLGRGRLFVLQGARQRGGFRNGRPQGLLRRRGVLPRL